ncbi:MAG: hypothetical protein H5T63_09860 [Chloroflexi bacterium]|nr:hypothetical protein [Chloroflexota bacterium]
MLEAFNVHWIQVRLVDGGEIGILPGHAPLLAETVTAPVRYADDAGEHAVLVHAGILQITPGEVSIYTTGLAEEGAIPTTPAGFDEEKPFARLMGTLLRNQAR